MDGSSPYTRGSLPPFAVGGATVSTADSSAAASWNASNRVACAQARNRRTASSRTSSSILSGQQQAECVSCECVLC